MNNALLAIILTCSSVGLLGQTRTITGKVISQDFYLFPAARIYNRDTVKMATTDRDGNFNVIIPADTKSLIIAGLSMEWKLIELPTGCDHLEVMLLNRSTYDFMSARKVDRLRKRDFEKLPDLYQSAYQRGFFRKAQPCYVDKFVPHRQELKVIRRRLTRY